MGEWPREVGILSPKDLEFDAQIPVGRNSMPSTIGDKTITYLTFIPNELF